MWFYQCFNNFVFVIIPARLLLSVELVTGSSLIFLSVIICADLARSSVDLTVIIGFFITSLTIIVCSIAAEICQDRFNPYIIPSRFVVKGWKDKTSENFKFALKFPKIMTY